jgi:hypothetical protein
MFPARNVSVNVGKKSGGGRRARDGDRSGVELVYEDACPRGIVHRWIRNDRNLADEFGARR